MIEGLSFLGLFRGSRLLEFVRWKDQRQGIDSECRGGIRRGNICVEELVRRALVLLWRHGLRIRTWS